MDDILMHTINKDIQYVFIFYLFVSLAIGRRSLFLLLHPLDFLLSTIQIPFPIAFPIKDK